MYRIRLLLQQVRSAWSRLALRDRRLASRVVLTMSRDRRNAEALWAGLSDEYAFVLEDGGLPETAPGATGAAGHPAAPGPIARMGICTTEGRRRRRPWTYYTIGSGDAVGSARDADWRMASDTAFVVIPFSEIGDGDGRITDRDRELIGAASSASSIGRLRRIAVVIDGVPRDLGPFDESQGVLSPPPKADLRSWLEATSTSHSGRPGDPLSDPLFHAFLRTRVTGSARIVDLLKVASRVVGAQCPLFLIPDKGPVRRAVSERLMDWIDGGSRRAPYRRTRKVARALLVSACALTIFVVTAGWTMAPPAPPEVSPVLDRRQDVETSFDRLAEWCRKGDPLFHDRTSCADLVTDEKTAYTRAFSELTKVQTEDDRRARMELSRIAQRMASLYEDTLTLVRAHMVDRAATARRLHRQAAAAQSARLKACAFLDSRANSGACKAPLGSILRCEVLAAVLSFEMGASPRDGLRSLDSIASTAVTALRSGESLAPAGGSQDDPPPDQRPGGTDWRSVREELASLVAARSVSEFDVRYRSLTSEPAHREGSRDANIWAEVEPALPAVAASVEPLFQELRNSTTEGLIRRRDRYLTRLKSVRLMKDVEYRGSAFVSDQEANEAASWEEWFARLSGPRTLTVRITGPLGHLDYAPRPEGPYRPAGCRATATGDATCVLSLERSPIGVPTFIKVFPSRAHAAPEPGDGSCAPRRDPVEVRLFEEQQSVTVAGATLVIRMEQGLAPRPDHAAITGSPERND